MQLSLDEATGLDEIMGIAFCEFSQKAIDNVLELEKTCKEIFQKPVQIYFYNYLKGDFLPYSRQTLGHMRATLPVTCYEAPKILPPLLIPSPPLQPPPAVIAPQQALSVSGILNPQSAATAVARPIPQLRKIGSTTFYLVRTPSGQPDLMPLQHPSLPAAVVPTPAATMATHGLHKRPPSPPPSSQDPAGVNPDKREKTTATPTSLVPLTDSLPLAAAAPTPAAAMAAQGVHKRPSSPPPSPPAEINPGKREKKERRAPR